MKALLTHAVVLVLLGCGLQAFASTATTTPASILAPPTCDKPYNRAEWRYFPAQMRHQLWSQNPYTAYTGHLFREPPTGQDAQVEHIVPLRYVHGVCGCKWNLSLIHI